MVDWPNLHGYNITYDKPDNERKLDDTIKGDDLAIKLDEGMSEEWIIGASEYQKNFMELKRMTTDLMNVLDFPIDEVAECPLVINNQYIEMIKVDETYKFSVEIGDLAKAYNLCIVIPRKDDNTIVQEPSNPLK